MSILTKLFFGILRKGFIYFPSGNEWAAKQLVYRLKGNKAHKHPWFKKNIEG